MRLLVIAAPLLLAGCGWGTTWGPTLINGGVALCDTLDKTAGLIDGIGAVSGLDEVIADIREDRQEICPELREIDAQVPALPTLVGEPVE